MPNFQTIPELMQAYQDNFIPEKAAGMDSVIQLHLKGEGGGPYYLAIHDQELDVHEGEHPDPTATATASVKDWLRLHNGDANPMTMMMKGKLKVKGDLAMATKFPSLFATE